MFKATDLPSAPWYVLRSDDKTRARLNLIKHLLAHVPYEAIPREKIKLPKRQKAHGYEEPDFWTDFQTASPDTDVGFEFGISDADIVELNIPTGIPLVYELDASLKPIKSYYLGDPDAAKKAAERVAAQAAAKPQSR